MISIVDGDELRTVLRPTVYRPTSDELRRGEPAATQEQPIVKGDSAVKLAAQPPLAR